MLKLCQGTREHKSWQKTTRNVLFQSQGCAKVSEECVQHVQATKVEQECLSYFLKGLIATVRSVRAATSNVSGALFSWTCCVNKMGLDG